MGPGGLDPLAPLCAWPRRNTPIMVTAALSKALSEPEFSSISGNAGPTQRAHLQSGTASAAEQTAKATAAAVEAERLAVDHAKWLQRRMRSYERQQQARNPRLAWLACCCCSGARDLVRMCSAQTTMEYALAYIMGEEFGKIIAAFTAYFFAPLVLACIELFWNPLDIEVLGGGIMLVKGYSYPEPVGNETNGYDSAEEAANDGARVLQTTALGIACLQFIFKMIAVNLVFGWLKRISNLEMLDAMYEVDAAASAEEKEAETTTSEGVETEGEIKPSRSAAAMRHAMAAQRLRARAGGSMVEKTRVRAAEPDHDQASIAPRAVSNGSGALGAPADSSAQFHFSVIMLRADAGTLRVTELCGHQVPTQVAVDFQPHVEGASGAGLLAPVAMVWLSGFGYTLLSQSTVGGVQVLFTMSRSGHSVAGENPHETLLPILQIGVGDLPPSGNGRRRRQLSAERAPLADSIPRSERPISIPRSESPRSEGPVSIPRSESPRSEGPASTSRRESPRSRRRGSGEMM